MSVKLVLFDHTSPFLVGVRIGENVGEGLHWVVRESVAQCASHVIDGRVAIKAWLAEREEAWGLGSETWSWHR